jgi:hypothetical protein
MPKLPLHLPKTPIGWIIWIVWTVCGTALARVVWVLVGLNLETYATEKKLDRLWDGPMLDPFSAGLGWWIVALAAACSFLGGYYLDRILVPSRQKKIAKRAEITLRFLPHGNPTEVGPNENVCAWDAIGVLAVSRDKKGKEIGRQGVAPWVVALWFTDDLQNYVTTIDGISGPIPLFDVRRDTARGAHVMIEHRDEPFVVRIRFEQRTNIGGNGD